MTASKKAATPRAAAPKKATDAPAKDDVELVAGPGYVIVTRGDERALIDEASQYELADQGWVVEGADKGE